MRIIQVNLVNISLSNDFRTTFKIFLMERIKNVKRRVQTRNSLSIFAVENLENFIKLHSSKKIGRLPKFNFSFFGNIFWARSFSSTGLKFALNTLFVRIKKLELAFSKRWLTKNQLSKKFYWVYKQCYQRCENFLSTFFVILAFEIFSFDFYNS